MKELLLTLTLTTLAFADFKAVYLIDKTIKQTTLYKDKDNVLFNISNKGKTLEDLIISNSSKYIRFKDQGVEHLYEITRSTEKIEDNKQHNKIPKNYKVESKVYNIKYLGFNAQKWTVKYNNGISEDILVTNDTNLTKSLTKSLNALKSLLPADKQNDASMFKLDNEFVILKTKDLELIEFSNEQIESSIIDINIKLNRKKQVELSKNIQDCFNSVCCGKRESIEAKELSHILKKDVDSWRLDTIVKCQNVTQKDLESALYKHLDSYIIVELSTQYITLEGKIVSLVKKGIKVEDINNTIVNGYETTAAYLPILDATIIDIFLPNSTMSLYTKGQKNLLEFAKKAILFKKDLNYTLNTEGI